MQVVYGGDIAFNALLYPEQNPVNAQFIQEQFNYIPDTLSDIGLEFVERTKNLYEKFHGSEVAQIAMNAIASVGRLFNPNQIEPLHSLTEIQTAVGVMQRWMMANPVMRELHNTQRCSSYDGEYQDNYPGTIGQSHYDYRRVMQGIAYERADGEMVFDEYVEDLVEGDRELKITEQASILSSWDIQNMFIKAGHDTSSTYGEKL